MIEALICWDELADSERSELGKRCLEVPSPLDASEQRAWCARFDDVSLVSDGFIPFRDSLDRAAASGVRYVLQPGGSVRDAEVTDAANQYGMAMAHSGVRLFFH